MIDKYGKLNKHIILRTLNETEKKKQARVRRATLEFQVKVSSKYGCAKVRLEKSYN